MTATLEVRATSDMSAARDDVLSLGEATRALGEEIRKDVTFDTLAESADNMASKASQATGAFGALGGGLEAIGATGAAEALQTAAVATDALSGASDLLNLVLESQTARLLISKAATVATTVATEAWTVAQVALNAVLEANPVALVVLAVLALVAAVVLAYRNSETFRDIVDGAFTRAKDVVEGAASAVSAFIDWLGKLPSDAKAAWDAVAGAVGDAVDDAKGFFDNLIDDVRKAPGEAAGIVKGAFEDMFKPILDAVGWVNDIIDKLTHLPSIHIPNPFGRTVGDGEGGLTQGVRPDEFTQLMEGILGPVLSASFTVPTVNLNVKTDPQDQDRAMRNLVDALREYLARNGQTLSITQ